MYYLLASLLCFLLVSPSTSLEAHDRAPSIRPCRAPFFSVNSNHIIACWTSPPQTSSLTATIQFANSYTTTLHPTTYTNNYCYTFDLPFGYGYPTSVQVSGFQCQFNSGVDNDGQSCGWDICDYRPTSPSSSSSSFSSRNTDNICSSPVDEKAILIELYNALGGPAWNHSNNWKNGSPCTNNWFGVSCDGNGRVNFIDLRRNNLVGDQLPSSLGCLEFLKGLHFDNNYIKGDLPNSLCSLTNIQYLTAPNNFISGSIPTCFSGLVHLLHLYLQHNRLVGELPDFSQYRGIKELHVEYNCLSGYIPQILETGQIIDMDFSGNNFEGCIPDAFKDLWVLYAGNRFCSGPIPCWLNPVELGCDPASTRQQVTGSNTCKSVNRCVSVLA